MKNYLRGNKTTLQEAINTATALIQIDDTPFILDTEFGKILVEISRENNVHWGNRVEVFTVKKAPLTKFVIHNIQTGFDAYIKVKFGHGVVVSKFSHLARVLITTGMCKAWVKYVLSKSEISVSNATNDYEKSIALMVAKSYMEYHDHITFDVGYLAMSLIETNNFPILSIRSQNRIESERLLSENLSACIVNINTLIKSCYVEQKDQRFNRYIHNFWRNTIVSIVGMTGNSDKFFKNADETYKCIAASDKLLTETDFIIQWISVIHRIKNNNTHIN